ncbi:hypothetical protein D3C85_731890 [compost metagenome]
MQHVVDPARVDVALQDVPIARVGRERGLGLAFRQRRVGSGVDVDDRADPVPNDFGGLDGHEIRLGAHVIAGEVPANRLEQIRRRGAIARAGQHRDRDLPRGRLAAVGVFHLGRHAVGAERVGDDHLVRCRRLDGHRRALAEGHRFAPVLQAGTGGRRVRRQVVADPRIGVGFLLGRHRREGVRIALADDAALEAHVGEARVEVRALGPPGEHLLDSRVVAPFVRLQAHGHGLQQQRQQLAVVLERLGDPRGLLRIPRLDVGQRFGLELLEQRFELLDLDDLRLGQLIEPGNKHRAHVTTSNDIFRFFQVPARRRRSPAPSRVAMTVSGLNSLMPLAWL